jgi:hypothetical protein
MVSSVISIVFSMAFEIFIPFSPSFSARAPVCARQYFRSR